jgi:DNA replication and repair protein RecF
VSSLLSLTLTDFRSYERAALRFDGRSVVLFGPNGAGKTNLLEAVSLLSPGRGLRGAAIAEMGRRLPGESAGRAFAVLAEIGRADDEGGPVRLGTGIEAAGSARRTVRVDGEPAPPARLADHVRPIWLTPAQDRLFLESAGERRRFFDRLVFAAEPTHAAHVGAYDMAMRERTRLLGEADPDPAWLTALEARMAQAGALMAAARTRTAEALQTEIDRRSGGHFPKARLALAGEFGAVDEGRLAAQLAALRERDSAAGRALNGPHRGDLTVIHADRDRPAAECSTGEQKALILNLVLAQATRLSRASEAPNPVVLLDEVAAHLDARRREALADEIAALGLQSFMTGTDQALFDHLKGRALMVRVDAAGPTILED